MLHLCYSIFIKKGIRSMDTFFVALLQVMKIQPHDKRVGLMSMRIPLAQIKRRYINMLYEAVKTVTAIVKECYPQIYVYQDSKATDLNQTYFIIRLNQCTEKRMVNNQITRMMEIAVVYHQQSESAPAYSQVAETLMDKLDVIILTGDCQLKGINKSGAVNDDELTFLISYHGVISKEIEPAEKMEQFSWKPE